MGRFNGGPGCSSWTALYEHGPFPCDRRPPRRHRPLRLRLVQARDDGLYRSAVRRRFLVFYSEGHGSATTTPRTTRQHWIISRRSNRSSSSSRSSRSGAPATGEPTPASTSRRSPRRSQKRWHGALPVRRLKPQSASLLGSEIGICAFGRSTQRTPIHDEISLSSGFAPDGSTSAAAPPTGLRGPRAVPSRRLLIKSRRARRAHEGPRHLLRLLRLPGKVQGPRRRRLRDTRPDAARRPPSADGLRQHLRGQLT